LSRNVIKKIKRPKIYQMFLISALNNMNHWMMKQLMKMTRLKKITMMMMDLILMKTTHINLPQKKLQNQKLIRANSKFLMAMNLLSSKLSFRNIRMFFHRLGKRENLMHSQWVKT